jgi:hypothetical protein
LNNKRLFCLRVARVRGLIGPIIATLLPADHGALPKLLEHVKRPNPTWEQKLLDRNKGRTIHIESTFCMQQVPARRQPPLYY